MPLSNNFKPSRGVWNSGRLEMHGYVDMSGAPLYAFGHSLSYTSFAYENLQLTPREMGRAANAR